MDIDDIFAKSDQFSAEVQISIPGDKRDRTYRPLVTYRYMNQDQIDAYLAGEPFELDGQVVEADDDASLLEAVLVKWEKFRVDGDEIEFSPENKAKALRHAPIRTPLAKTYMERLHGGGRGGRQGRRKN